MMDELKQQFYEVMHKYQKPFSEEARHSKPYAMVRTETGAFAASAQASAME